MAKYVKQAYTGIDFYNSYMEFVKGNPLYEIEYKVFRAIIDDYFRYLRDELIENGKEIKLPCRMGTLQIVKHKPKTFSTTGRRSLRIDYGESKKLGKMVFHLNEHSGLFKYRFLWSKQVMLTHNKTKYQLVMTRDNKRRLAQIIKNHERDYIEI